MTAPVYVNKSAFASGTGALSVTAIPGVVADDLILLFVESANEAVTTPSGYTIAPSSPQSIGTAAAAGGVRLSVFYEWATGADGTDTVADSGNHTTAIKIAIRGVHRTNPFNANAGSTQAATTAMSFPGVTTTVADCLIVHGCAQDTDAASTTTSGTPTNANLTSLTERHDQTVTAGVGGGLVVITGVKATAGATGNTTSTGSTSVTHAYVTLALASLPDITGSLAATETGSDTVVADGTVGAAAITGTVSATESGSDTSAIAGKVIVSGDAAATETGSDTVAADGAVVHPNTNTDSTFVDITTTSMVAITDVLPVRTDATGSLTFSGALAFEPLTLTTGVYNTAVIWRYRTVGGSWTDVGTETTSTNPSVVTGGVLDNAGDVSAAATQTSLSANTNYEVQLYARRISASPTNTITFSGTAQVTSVPPPITGTLSATETGADTCVSTGDVIVQGSLAATESGSDTAALTGDVIIQGALSATEAGSDTAVITGDVIVQGTLAATESGSDTVVSTGKVIVQGNLSATETGSDTVVSTGTITVQGNLSATESSSDTAVILGDVIVQGTLAATEIGSDTAAISGVIGTPAITGTINATEVGNDTAVIVGDVFVQGNLAVTEVGSDTAAISGQVAVQGLLDAVEVGGDTASMTGTVGASEITGSLAAQEASSDTCFSYGFTLDAEPIVEYNIRLFDSMRSSGNLRGAYKSVRGLEHMMWDRVLQKCVYNPNVYVTADDPDTWRIGYGRPVTRSFATEEAELRKVRENIWLRSKLTELYKRVASANPTAELPDVLLSTLYYYHVENQKR